MKTVYFRDFDTAAHNAAYNLYRALCTCKEAGAGRLVFDCAKRYELDPAFCAERNLCISNHGYNGPHRIGVLIEQMHDFEIDFAGSTLCMMGEGTHFAILDSRNIKVRNVVLENPENMFMQVRVAAHGDGFVDVTPMNGREQFAIRRQELVCPAPRKTCNYWIETNIEFTPDGEIAYGTADHTMGNYIPEMRCEQLADGNLRFYDVRRYPPVGNILIISAARRLGAGFFLCDSSEIVCEDVTVHSCLGMGLIAQMCENIHLNRFCTVRAEGLYYSATADATHFVDCNGRVTVENCMFEGQLDDALNIHGIYTRVLAKDKNELFVREMHNDAKGIRIYHAGDRVQALHPQTLIPYTEKTVEAVEYINGDLIRLVLSEETDDIRVGDDIENISHNVELVFRRNTVKNNRARGMLIAARGKTLIEDCTFHTSGVAILFESDGAYWFESGGTEDVTIRNCLFDRCKHGGWGRGVIECVARPATEEGKYFHHCIRITENEFRMLPGDAIPAAIFDNVQTAVFTDNRMMTASGAPATVVLHHIGQAEVQPDTDLETVPEEM